MTTFSKLDARNDKRCSHSSNDLAVWIGNKIQCLVVLVLLFCYSLSSVGFGKASTTIQSSTNRDYSRPVEVVDSKVAAPSKARLKNSGAALPFSFVKNEGQFDRQTKFKTSNSAASVSFLRSEIVYEPTASRRKGPMDRVNGSAALPLTDRVSSQLRFKFRNANPNVRVTGVQRQNTSFNYLKGNVKSRWHTKVPAYDKVRYERVFPGIDAIFYGNGTDLEYDFIVSPGSDPRKIGLTVIGAKSCHIDADGNLVMETESGPVMQKRPIAYQYVKGEKREIPAAFEPLDAMSFGIKVSNYDREMPLIIDPVITYESYFGGFDNEECRDVAVDAAGNLYLTGSVESSNGTSSVGRDVFVAKINPANNSLIYYTTFGGQSDDQGNALAIDSSGSAYLTGYSGSWDLPNVHGLAATFAGGTSDMFVAKIAPNGSTISYSTFLGGSAADVGNAIAINSSGDVYVTGVTDSPELSALGGSNIFVAKINPIGSGNYFQLTFGGSLDDGGAGIAVDSSGSCYIAGFTESQDFLTTPGSFQPSFGGGSSDGFVLKVSPDGSSLTYSTYWGGLGDDVAQAIALDVSNNAYVTGSTSSQELGVLGGRDAFVLKINPSGTQKVYLALIGGTAEEYGYGIKVSSGGQPVIVGRTESNDFPLVSAVDNTMGGKQDAFISRLDGSGSSLVFSSYLGGNSDDSATNVALDSVSRAYVVGSTYSDDLRLVNAYQNSYSGNGDGFLLRVAINNAVFDFDADGKTDLSVFRPNGATGSEWWYQKSSDGGSYATQFGSSTDRIVPTDYTGDGKTDVAFWRPATGQWFVLRSEDLTFYAFPFGSNGDVPVPGDFDGDGKADAAVFRPTNLTWYVSKSSGGTDIVGFGAVGDKPVVADYDGDGKADIAVFRPSGANGAEWWIRRSSNLSVFATQFGGAADKAVPGDYTGDGKADIAFWQTSTGLWYVLRSEDFSFFAFPFGSSTDIPSPGDYDGDGKTDAAVFRPSNSTWYAQRSTSGLLIQQFGAAGDVPVPSAFVR